MCARCGGCRYGVPVYIGDGDELLTACVYILRTGKRRPCPPGEDCRAYESAEGLARTDERRDAYMAQRRAPAKIE